MRKINPLPNEPAILETSVPRKLPPYPLGVTMGAPGISEMQPPYPNSSINLPCPMPEPSTIEPESENVTESIQRIQDSLQLFELSKSTEIESPKRAGSGSPHPSTPSPSYISKFLSSDCQNIMSELANIKYELSQEMAKKMHTMSREALKKVSQKIRLEMSNMTPEETEVIANELLSVKSAYLDAIEKNVENHSSSNKSETKEPVFPVTRKSNICINEPKEAKINGTNMPVMFKLLQMIMNTVNIYCIAKLTHVLQIYFTIYCEVVAVAGFLISFILLCIYLKNRMTGFNSSCKFDLVYCILMTVSYFITTLITTAGIQFLWRHFFLEAVISGIFTIAIYLYDAWHNLLHKLSHTHRNEDLP